MKYLPKALIANFVLFSAATLFADYGSSYQAPIHQNGKMPDGSTVYEQNMQSRPPNQNWTYDPAISAQWRQSDGSTQQGQDYNPSAYQTNPPSNPSDRPSDWTSDRDDRTYQR